jgi:hypothetical protein
MPKVEGDNVTMSKAELAAFVEEQKRQATMDPQEKRLREIIAEEVGSRLEAFFEEVTPDPAKPNEPKVKGEPPAADDDEPAPKGLLDQVSDWLSGNSGNSKEPAAADAD